MALTIGGGNFGHGPAALMVHGLYDLARAVCLRADEALHLVSHFEPELTGDVLLLPYDLKKQF